MEGIEVTAMKEEISSCLPIYLTQAYNSHFYTSATLYHFDLSNLGTITTVTLPTTTVSSKLFAPPTSFKLCFEYAKMALSVCNSQVMFDVGLTIYSDISKFEQYHIARTQHE